MDVEKENLPTIQLKLSINDLLNKIKYLKTVEVGNKAMFRNI